MDRPAFDWKYVLTLLVAVAGIAAPVLLWQFDLSGSKSLTVRLLSSVPLLKADQSTGGLDVQLTMDGVQLSNPYISTIEIVNDGSKPIAAQDFESPLEIGTGPGAKVVRAKVAASQPKDIPANLSSEKETIKLQPLLLNPSDTLTSVIITSNASPVFSPKARIAGIRQVSYEDRTPMAAKWKAATFNLLVAAGGMFLYFYYAFRVIKPQAAPVGRFVAAATAFLCVAAFSLTVRRAYELSAIELSKSEMALTAIVFLLMSFAVSRFMSRRARVAAHQRWR